MNNWEYLGSSADSSIFIIRGVDVWKYEWIQVMCAKAKIKDPIYQQDFLFDLYEIKANDCIIRFAAGEFSNCVWGFFKEGL